MTERREATCDGRVDGNVAVDVYQISLRLGHDATKHLPAKTKATHGCEKADRAVVGGSGDEHAKDASDEAGKVECPLPANDVDQKAPRKRANGESCREGGENVCSGGRMRVSSGREYFQRATHWFDLRP